MVRPFWLNSLMSELQYASQQLYLEFVLSTVRYEVRRIEAQVEVELENEQATASENATLADPDLGQTTS